jgi:hypothetical protein
MSFINLLYRHRKYQAGYLERGQEEMAQKLRNMNQVK